MTQIIIRDEILGKGIQHELLLNLDIEFSTVKELIRERIHAEVNAYNTKQPEYFNSLIQPTNAEVTLNGYRLKAKRKMDVEEQCKLAFEGFKNNGYFLLINDNQVTDLEERVQIKEQMQLTFIKLTPLVGG